MTAYIVTVEVRLSVQADSKTDAQLKAEVGLLDPASAERDGTEWLGYDIVCITEDY
jgi:hypothetical protein